MAFSEDKILTYQYSKESLISTFSVVPEFGFALIIDFLRIHLHERVVIILKYVSI